MYNNKGFTLIELMASMIVLTLITLIIIPIINGVMNDNREKLYNDQISGIIDSAKLWGSSDIKRLPNEGETITVSLGELVNSGFAKKDLENPKTNKPFDPLTTIVIIYNNNGSLEYKVEVE